MYRGIVGHGVNLHPGFLEMKAARGTKGSVLT